MAARIKAKISAPQDEGEPKAPLETTALAHPPKSTSKRGPKPARFRHEMIGGVPIPRRMVADGHAWRVICTFCVSKNAQMTLSASGAYNLYCFDCKSRTHFSSPISMALFRAWQRFLGASEAQNYLRQSISSLYCEEAVQLGLPVMDVEELPPLFPENPQ